MADIALGLDLGTGGVRVVAIDPMGQVMAQSTQMYPLLTPQPGWTEQNPHDWVQASLQALSEVAQQVQGHTVMGLGLSGQMHGMVPLTADGQVVRPAILWNDQRTGAAVAAIEQRIPREELIQRTGNPAITGFQLPKLMWLRHQEADAFAQTHRVLLPKDYLGYVLTGEQVTEPSDASGVGCLNLKHQQWDEEILNALELDPGLFPPVIQSTAIAGYLTPGMATRTGLPAGLPVIAGGGDNAAAAIGLGISGANLQQGSLSIGTSGVIFAPLQQPTPDPDGRVHLFCHVDGGYHLLGVTLAAGGALRWYRDTFVPHLSFEQLMQLAAQSPPGARGVMFVPHLAGERSPYLDPEARGAWVNLTLAHTSADIVRSLLEGVAFSLQAAQEVIVAIAPLHHLIATGGGTRSVVWQQIFADVLTTELHIPVAAEGAAYGAALLALVGTEIVPTLAAACRIIPQAKQIVQPTAHAAYAHALNRFTTLYTTLKRVR